MKIILWVLMVFPAVVIIWCWDVVTSLIRLFIIYMSSYVNIYYRFIFTRSEYIRERALVDVMETGITDNTQTSRQRPWEWLEN